MVLQIDLRRVNRTKAFPQTGILVRAVDGVGKVYSVDISALTRESLHEWLRSQGGENLLAENTVLALLNYHQFVAPLEPTVTTKLFEAAKGANQAIDMLLAHILTLDKSFRPTESAVWPELVALNNAIKAMECAKTHDDAKATASINTNHY